MNAPATPDALCIDSRRKLLPLQFFCILHGVESDVALQLVEDHALYPAFNLSSRSDGKRKVHLWRGAIQEFRYGKPASKPKLEQIIDATLPMLGLTDTEAATIRGVELAYRFCLCSDSIAQMVRAGELREIGHHDPINETYRISYGSVVSFLERRVI
jgi:hypothetical protein